MHETAHDPGERRQAVPSQTQKPDYDVVIIGAGMSGLAAGIRLAHFGKKVLILEAHTICGGLNSYYTRRGVPIDVGLHAMTNFVKQGAKRAPLTKLLRQLRIPYRDLGLIEQLKSRVQFASCSLKFTNDFSVLRSEVAEKFPNQINGFDRLTEAITNFNETALDSPVLSVRKELSQYISDPLLTDMLLAPLMYYGNSQEHDMAFDQFAIMWKSIYQSGMARPEAGMKHLINLLLKRYTESGGELRLGTRIQELRIENQRVASLVLPEGEELRVKTVLSSAGFVETMRLCSDQDAEAFPEHIGKLSFIELVALLDRPPSELGIEDTIIFFNKEDRFTYRRPDGPIDLSSGVICCPGNFHFQHPPRHQMIRFTVKASYPQWLSARQKDRHDGGNAYASLKRETEQRILNETLRYLPDFTENVVFTDLFTPLTIQRFTGHVGGAVYGSSKKQRRGLTPISNLFLCGTDQGFLGIVGSMLSGITIANLHCLAYKT